MRTKDIKNKLRQKPEKQKLTGKDFLSTGSTLLNLACTGRPYYGFAKGRYYFIVGDSISGKTFLSLTCLAEASINPNFDNYRFIYDNVEDGALMDFEKFFGKGVANRIEPPGYDDVYSQPIHSSTIEEFYYHIDDAIQWAIRENKPFIYILDSMDGLSSEDEKDKFISNKNAFRKGKDSTGSYGDGKAKKNSACLRQLLTPLKKTGSILIVISQTRDNLRFGFDKKTRSGGRSLRFYACLELWSSVKKVITKLVKGKPRILGNECTIRVKKNRVSGKDRSITIPIYPSFGFDDIGSCVDYLIEEGHWKQKGNNLLVKEFDFKGSKEKLIRYIESEGLEKDLRDVVSDVWNEIEAACEVKRKKRYE